MAETRAQRTGPSERGAVAADSLFETLLADLEPAQRDRLLRLLRQVRLDANDDDPIWRLFVALQWHLKRYEDIPRQIHQTALKTLEDTTAAVEAAVRETESTMVAALAAKVAGTAETLAGRKALKTVLMAATAAIAVFALALGGSWRWLERIVREDYAQRYEQWFNQELRKAAEQEQVDPELLRWARQFTAQIQDPDFTQRLRFAAQHPDDMRWLQSERGRAL
ncbi:MAG TPA: hypothetical protein VES89_13020, partial [Candidatus Competibacteraceae bacterium]|nr:hypothetical protein [Candidatus Competibacteraceae bacterium]